MKGTVLRLCLFLALSVFSFQEYLKSYPLEFINDIVIKNILIVKEDNETITDIVLNKGKIVFIGNAKSIFSRKTINGTGKILLPGGIDPHVHLDMPFMNTHTIDNYTTGHMLALLGGTTTHFDFVIPENDSLIDALHQWEKKSQNAKINYGFHIVITKYNEKIKNEMTYLAQEKGICTFKFFLAYKGSLMISAEEFILALNHVKILGCLALVHAEDGDMVRYLQSHLIDMGVTNPYGHHLSRPSALETLAVHHTITYSTMLSVPVYVVHVMAGDAADVIVHFEGCSHGRKKVALKEKRDTQRKRGYGKYFSRLCFAEVTLGGLLLEEGRVKDTDFGRAARFVMSPPLRTKRDNERLTKHLVKGDIDTIGTDHATFSPEQKRMGQGNFMAIPNGINGIHERVLLAYQRLVIENKLSRTDYAKAVSTNAAKIFGLYPRKGVIEVSSDADLIILEERKGTLGSLICGTVDYDCFEDFKTEALIHYTIINGEIAAQKGNIIPGTYDKLHGERMKVQPFNPYLYLEDSSSEELEGK